MLFLRRFLSSWPWLDMTTTFQVTWHIQGPRHEEIPLSTVTCSDARQNFQARLIWRDFCQRQQHPLEQPHWLLRDCDNMHDLNRLGQRRTQVQMLYGPRMQKAPKPFSVNAPDKQPSLNARAAIFEHGTQLSWHIHGPISVATVMILRTQHREI